MMMMMHGPAWADILPIHPEINQDIGKKQGTNSQSDSLAGQWAQIIKNPSKNGKGQPKTQHTQQTQGEMIQANDNGRGYIVQTTAREPPTETRTYIYPLYLFPCLQPKQCINVENKKEKRKRRDSRTGRVSKSKRETSFVLFQGKESRSWCRGRGRYRENRRLCTKQTALLCMYICMYGEGMIA